MITKDELAARLNGREYRHEMTNKDEVEAILFDLVIAFGRSDDCIELRGALNDEWSAYQGREFWFTRDGEVPTDEELETLKKYDAMPKLCDLSAEWSPEDKPGLSWRITTLLPSAAFTIMEDGEPFCEGVVFELPKK